MDYKQIAVIKERKLAQENERLKTFCGIGIQKI